MVDYNEGDPIGAEINSIMVSGAFVSIATILGHDDDEDEDVLYPLLETRIFTVDGQEHHLMWPPQACLPLLESIGKLMITVIGGVHPEHGRVPDDPSDIDWYPSEGDE